MLYLCIWYVVSLEWLGIGFPGEAVKMQERPYNYHATFVITSGHAKLCPRRLRHQQHIRSNN